MKSEVARGARDHSAFTALDLFSGAGGFSLGLELVGFRSLGAIDISEIAGRTYAQNFGERPLSRFGPNKGDLRKVKPGELTDALRSERVKELDLLVAAPPCQGFSRVGRGKLDSMAEKAGAFVLDPRNHLYRQAIAILHELRPRMFLYENVAGILHVRGQNIAEKVCRAVAGAGYRVRCALLNSAWYGVAQSRERLFIIGVREDLDEEPAFPARERTVTVRRGNLSQATMNPGLWEDDSYFIPFADLPSARRLSPAVSVRAALADLPAYRKHLTALRNGKSIRARRELAEVLEYARAPSNKFCRLMRSWPNLPSGSEVFDHFCRWTPRDFETFRRMKPGDRYTEALAIARERYAEAREAYEEGRGPFPRKAEFIPPYPDDCFDEKWRKLASFEPSYTITAHLSKDTYSHIHFDSTQARSITLREAARLQSFPDGFRFVGNMGDMFTQIGNAVPPLLAAAVGRPIAEILARTRAVEWQRSASPRKSAAGR